MHQGQKEIDEYFKKEGWAYWSPHEILARLMEETGELARLINHQYGPKKKKINEAEQLLSDEVGDILYTLACLANREGFSLDAALRDSITKVKSRDHKRFSSHKEHG